MENNRRQNVCRVKRLAKYSTGNDVYSGDPYSGNDRYSGPKPPDDAILFTVSGITAIADKKMTIFT